MDADYGFEDHGPDQPRSLLSKATNMTNSELLKFSNLYLWHAALLPLQNSRVILSWAYLKFKFKFYQKKLFPRGNILTIYFYVFFPLNLGPIRPFQGFRVPKSQK